jgi:hypothetical protein
MSKSSTVRKITCNIDALLSSSLLESLSRNLGRLAEALVYKRTVLAPSPLERVGERPIMIE